MKCLMLIVNCCYCCLSGEVCALQTSFVCLPGMYPTQPVFLMFLLFYELSIYLSQSSHIVNHFFSLWQGLYHIEMRVMTFTSRMASNVKWFCRMYHDNKFSCAECYWMLFLALKYVLWLHNRCAHTVLGLWNNIFQCIKKSRSDLFGYV